MGDHPVSTTHKYELDADFRKYRYRLRELRDVLRQTRDYYGKREAEFRHHHDDNLEIYVENDAVRYTVPGASLRRGLPADLLEGCTVQSVHVEEAENDDAWMTLEWQNGPPQWLEDEQEAYVQEPAAVTVDPPSIPDT